METSDIIKPATDERTYKVVVLPNGLRCLLIHDEDAEKSAASMDVNIGSACDSREQQGLAHFLEHMLFMGTEKYPDENAYSEFI